jgi:hypothetical protein
VTERVDEIIQGIDPLDTPHRHASIVHVFDSLINPKPL